MQSLAFIILCGMGETTAGINRSINDGTAHPSDGKCNNYNYYVVISAKYNYYNLF